VRRSGATASEMSGSAVVPVRRTSYPQVDPRAAGLMHRRLVVVPPGLAVAPAARLADRQRARLVVGRIGRTWAAASRDTLDRALALGLGRAPVSAVFWEVSVAPATASEVDVRHRLGPDRPFLLVGGPRGPEGVVLREPGAPVGLPLSVASELDRLPGRAGEILRAAGAQGDALGLPVAAVGGLVRDLLLGRADKGMRPRSPERSPGASADGPWSTPSSSRPRSSSRTDAGSTSRPRAANPTARRAPCPASSPPRSRRISRAATSP
jgi:hypothetical protein